MSKSDNMLAILWVLRSGEKITAKQISEKLEMNIRTVYRYIDALSTSGVPIISESGHNGGYTLMKNFIEAPLFFDFEEQTSLFHAAVFAEEAGYYGGEALNRAVSKLSKYSNPEQEIRIKQQLSRLEVISQTSSGLMRSLMKELEKAIAEGYSVSIKYYKHKEKEYSDRLVDPYSIIYWKHKWYMMGLCHLRHDIRSFRIDRIESLLQSDHVFKRPDNFSASDHFKGGLLPKIKDKDSMISLVVNADNSVLNDICQHWFLGHYLHERSTKHAVFLLESEILHTFVPYLLLPFNKSIKVVEPISLKKRMVDVLLNLITFYEE